MWSNDSYMPEYLLNNHEAYIGETFPEILKGFISTFGIFLAATIFMGVMNYYFNVEMLDNFTFTKVSHENYFNNANAMKTDRIGL